MKNNPKYLQICNCGTEMEVKIDTHQYIKNNPEGLELEEYNMMCPNCARCVTVKIEKREIK